MMNEKQITEQVTGIGSCSLKVSLEATAARSALVCESLHREDEKAERMGRLLLLLLVSMYLALTQTLVSSLQSDKTTKFTSASGVTTCANIRCVSGCTCILDRCEVSTTTTATATTATAVTTTAGE